MLNAILISSAVLLTGLFLLFSVRRSIAKEKEALSVILRSYFEPRGEDNSSEFAELINVVATINAEKVTQSLKGTFMGIQSVDKRQEQAVTGAFIEDLANQKSPLLGTILAQFPAVKKRLIKNPELLSVVGDIGQKLLSQKGQGSSGNNGKNDFEFKL